MSKEAEPSRAPPPSAEEDDALCLTKLIYPWVSDLLWRGRDRAINGEALQNEDLLRLPKAETCAATYHETFAPRWEAEIADYEARLEAFKKQEADIAAGAEPPKKPLVEPQPRLAMVLMKCWLPTLLLGTFFRVVADACQVAGPFLLQGLVQFFEDFENDGAEAYEGYIWAAACGVNQFIIAFCNQASLHYSTKACMNMRTATTMAIFDKAGTMCRGSGITSGRVITMHATDTSKFAEAAQFAQNLVTAPFLIVGALVGLYLFIGWSTFVAVLIIIATLPLQIMLVKRAGMARMEARFVSDRRLQAVQEFVQGIRIVKFMNWEQKFIDRTGEIRDEELAAMKVMVVVRAALVALIIFIPSVLIFSVVAVGYGLFDEEITASSIYPVMAMLNVLRMPVMVIPIAAMRLADVVIAVSRIGTFLVLPDHHAYLEVLGSQKNKGKKPAPALELTNVVVECVDLEKKEAEKDQEKEPSGSGRGRGGPGGRGRGGSGGGSGRGGAGSPSAGGGGPSIGGEPLVVSSKRKTLMKVPHLAIPHGALTVVIGPTASGKSTLVSALIGDALVVEGSHAVARGTVAYVAQEAWIMNTTVQKNVTLHQSLDETAYHAAMEACQLTTDLETLAAGDQTEIGERGINLSGGQKQRISFARAVYSGRDIVVMDDPLSAVDPHVCQALFHDCICGALKSKTRVLVTHQQQFLPHADHVVVVDNLEVKFSGTYADLLRRSDLTPLLSAALMSPTQSTPKELALTSPKSLKMLTAARESEEEGPKKVADEDEDDEDKGKLIEKEGMDAGEVKWEVFVWYIRQFGIHWFILVLALYAVWRAVAVMAEFSLSAWGSRVALFGTTPSQDQYLMTYGILIFVTGIFVVVRASPFVSGTLRASRMSHEQLVVRMLRAPVSFYDVTPTGRILNRFGKDLEAFDVTIPEMTMMFLNTFFTLLGGWALIAVVYFVIPVMVLIIVAFAFVYNFYISTSGPLKRLDAVNRSPVAIVVTELLGGVSTIRSFGLAAQFDAVHHKALDVFAQSSYCALAVQRWLGIRIAFFANIVAIATAVIGVGVLHMRNPGEDREEYVPLVSLAITYGITLAPMAGMFTQSLSEIVASFAAVERIAEFTKDVPQERDIAEYGAVDAAPDAALPPPPPAAWPQHGAIEFRNASLRYRPDLPLVLKGITCSVKPGEKVGVVGRTGSGKSTLMLALFRMVELAGTDSDSTAVRVGATEPLAAAEPSLGSISIDGVDITKLRLSDLRGAVTIIPQDPMLFAGTVRSNLDPFATADDARLWDVLKHCGMADRVRREPDGIDSVVADRGANFSVGERQLLCLARAMLKDCKVLLLDEATASIDPQQDALLQKTIRTEFAHCTVLTIAHRLHTIIDSDKVLVLDNGSAVQFGSPSSLLRDAHGLFASMVAQLGPQMAQELRRVANAKTA